MGRAEDGAMAFETMEFPQIVQTRRTSTGPSINTSGTWTPPKTTLKVWQTPWTFAQRFPSGIS